PIVVDPAKSIVITGSGFDPAVQNDKVSLGQEFATVTKATANQLVVTVPAGPSFSGQVVVTTPRGTVRGPDVFMAPPGFTAPQVGFVGRLANAKPQVVSLPVAGKVGLLAIDSPGNQRLSATLTNSTIASGDIQILAPGGAPLPAGGDLSFDSSGGFLAPALLPTRGTYAVAVKPDQTNAGTVTLTPFLVADQKTTITANGPAVIATITTPGQRSLLAFAGTVGEHVSVALTKGTFKDCGELNLLKADGSVLAGGDGCNQPTNFVAGTLRAAGTYTVEIGAAGPDTGSASIQLFSFVDQKAAIAANGPAVTASI